MSRYLKSTFLLLLLCGLYPLQAQQAYFGFRQGYGWYSMKSLDRLQELRRIDTELPLRTTESFPGALNYHVETGQFLPAFVSKWSICYGYASTGARSTMSDYSGRYDVDAIINGHQLGITLEHCLNTIHGMQYGAYVESGAAYTRLKTHDFFNLVYPGHITYQISYDFAALGGYTEAGMFLQYGYRFMQIRLNFGYLVDYMGALHLRENKDAILYLDNSKLRPQWDGLRVGLQVNILFRKAENTK